AKTILIAEIQNARVARREYKRKRPVLAINLRIRERGIYVLGLPSFHIEFGYRPKTVTIDQPRMQWIGSDIAILSAGSDFAELHHVNAIAAAGAAGNCSRA